ncbi:MAG: nuclear transport factor 2 family protein [Chryseolinea sp.]
MRFPILLILLSGTLTVSTTIAQSPDHAAIEANIRQVFAGMEKGDSVMVHQSFSKQVTMATVKTNKEGKLELAMESSIGPWLASIGTPHADKYYEEIWGIKTSIDGAFAQVWCDYAFYIGNKFHHCGVDAFQLSKDSGSWKIFHVADTRRTMACDVPAGIQAKHK